MQHIDIEGSSEQQNFGQVYVSHSRDKNRIDGPLLTKMIVGAVCFTEFTMMAAVRVMVETFGDDAAVNPVVAVIIAMCAFVVGAGIGAILGTKDIVQQRMTTGVYVGPIRRFLFGSGSRSLAIWIALVYFCALVVLIILMAIGVF